MSNNAPASKKIFVLNAVVIAAIFALFATIIYLVARMTQPLPIASTSATTAAERAATLADLRAKENAAATSYGWIDEQKGIVRLPIDRAVELTIQDLNKNRPPVR